MILLPASKEAIWVALEAGECVIGCSCPDSPCGYTGLVLENVWRFEAEGYWAEKLGSAVIISYGISPAPEADDSGYVYRIHDDSMSVVRGGAEMGCDALAKSLLLTYDAVLLDEGDIDRRNVYGKLGTEFSEQVVFVNSVNGKEDC